MFLFRNCNRPEREVAWGGLPTVCQAACLAAAVVINPSLFDYPLLPLAALLTISSPSLAGIVSAFQA